VTTTTGRPARGRPRGFDRDVALDRALRVFWQHGYEATSIGALTTAMGINAPSLYAAFGDKRSLFNEAVRVYQATYGSVLPDAMAAESTARAAVARMLREAARAYTDPTHPPGCLVITAAANCTPGSADVEAQLRELRNANVHAVQQRIAADVDSGQLPAGTDVRGLAVLTGALLQGMSQQARDGASERDLCAAAELAMAAWPAPPGRD
jgi:TetR/AcrR family transcriptional regulator, copper-responsive repressor